MWVNHHGNGRKGSMYKYRNCSTPYEQIGWEADGLLKEGILTNRLMEGRKEGWMGGWIDGWEAGWTDIDTRDE